MTDQQPAESKAPAPAPAQAGTPAAPVTASGSVMPPPAIVVGTAPATAAALPRWGVQTGLFQRRQPAFWLFVVLLIFTTLTVLTEQLTYLQVFPAGWMFSIVLLTLYVLPVAVAIWILDLFEREPISLILGAFAWGGIVSIGVAATANTAWLQAIAKLFGPNFAQTWGPAIVAPPIEETVKYLGLVMIYLIARSEIDDLFDGFVYGAVIGLGFAAVENVQYFIQAVATAGGGDQIGPVLSMFTLRSILVGAYMHVMWTGLTGIGLAYYVTRRDQPHSRRLLVAVGLFVAGTVAHMVWNSPVLNELLRGFGGILVFGIIKGLPFLAFLGFLVYLAQKREHRWFSTLTARDVGSDVMSERELADLGSLRRRWSARRQVGTAKGPQGAKLAGQLQREQVNLAMIRSRAGSDDDPSVAQQRERIRAIRAQLAALPDVPRPVAPAPTMATAPTVTAAPVSSSAIAAQPPAAPAPWAPTHVVPPAGMAAWDMPDPARPPVATLAPGVVLTIAEERGAWARVVGSNGWTGWVDGRLLTRLA